MDISFIFFMFEQFLENLVHSQCYSPIGVTCHAHSNWGHRYFIRIYFMFNHLLKSLCILCVIPLLEWHATPTSTGHWGRDKMAAVLEMLFSNSFLYENYCTSTQILLKFVPTHTQPIMFNNIYSNTHRFCIYSHCFKIMWLLIVVFHLEWHVMPSETRDCFTDILNALTHKQAMVVLQTSQTS